jgi:hypothetical protein
MIWRLLGTGAAVCFFLTMTWAQSPDAVLSGTVAAVGGNSLPSVTITATNVGTGIVTSVLTNNSGAYVFQSLQPGAYELGAILSGFQTQTIRDVELGNAQVRVNFALTLGSGKAEENPKVDTVMAVSSASAGDVLSEGMLRTLPLVGNDALDLVRILPGVTTMDDQAPAFSPFGFAGVPDVTLNTARDGGIVSDGRFAFGAFGTTLIHPDLISEIRLILAPVDAELGRGNGQVQIRTRSGTDRFTGSAVWSIRNSALNANTWFNNSNVDSRTSRWEPLSANWHNNHQYTLSLGGPIVRNKTFFFALWDQQLNFQRENVVGNVLTNPARQGIFRYFNNWVPGNALTVTNPGGANPTMAAVDFAGNPVPPRTNPNNTAFTGSLQCFSVFGNVKFDGTPFTAADCPGGNALIGTAAWDSRRPVADPTGYLRKILNVMPEANYFGTGDGLNLAGHRWVRRRRGNSGFDVATGFDPFSDRKQINTHIDHHLSSRGKLNLKWSHERVEAEINTPTWPGGLSYLAERRPHVLTASFTSALPAGLVNQARFSLRHNVADIIAPWESEELREEAMRYSLPGSNGYSAFINPGFMTFALGGSNPHGIMIMNPDFYTGNKTRLYSYADSLQWSTGRHTMKAGGELRFGGTNAYHNGPIMPFPRINGGPGVNNSSLGDVIASLPNRPAAARTASANMLYLLAGSVQNSLMLYWIDDPGDVAGGKWEDVQTKGKKYRDQKSREWNVFWKDDWKITRGLTLNIGLRYEYYGSPYIASGIATTTRDQGDGLWGVFRTGGNPFERFLSPGNAFLTGYGPNVSAADALKCAAPGCDPSTLSVIEFIGPTSPNPGKRLIPADRNNFGPAIGFVWALPWLGESRTTLRGGYQITYGGSLGSPGISSSSIGGTETVMGNPLTNTSSAVLMMYVAEFGGQYLDLQNVPLLVPARPTNPARPGRQLDVFGSSGDFFAYDARYVTPYVQNFNLSATRSLSENLSMNVRYIGSIAGKQPSRINLNTPNVYHNPELFGALELTRAGGNAPLFDQMLAGLNLNNGVAGYGPVGTTTNGVLQHGSAHLRRNPAIAPHLANGNFAQVAVLLNGNGSNMPATGAIGGFLNLPTGLTGVGARLLRNGCDRIAAGQATVGPANPSAMRCFPENYLRANPQLGNAFLGNNSASSNYHSLQAQVQFRPSKGLMYMATYTWSKSLGVPGLASFGSGVLDPDYSDPSDTSYDYSYTNLHRTHDFRATGSFELPTGPGKPLFGNSSGWLARLMEGWQTSVIVTLNSGARTDVSSTYLSNAGVALPTGVYGGSVPDIARSWPSLLIKDATWVDGYGSYLPGPFLTVPDPQCLAVTTADNLRTSCTLSALAAMNFLDGSPGDIVLKNPKPGTRGTLGRGAMELPGMWNFDANLSKMFVVSESGWIRTIQLRFDATNVLNHPNPGYPDLNINSGAPFGIIFAKGDLARSLQGQVRVNF